MQIEIKIDPACGETRVLVTADSMSEEVSSILQRLSEDVPQILAGFREERLEVLEPSEILRIYAEDGKVFAVTASGIYTMRQRLYELEERLDKKQFVRISNSEIINLKKVRGFDLSISGTICVSLTNGSVTYVSRRYVSRIKQVLGV